MTATDTASLFEREIGEPRRGRREVPHIGLPDRRRWLGMSAIAVGWALWSTGIGRTRIVNTRGWPLLRSFFGAVTHPELEGSFLRRIASATLVTGAYAMLGTVLSVLVGAVGGVVMSETWWARSLASRQRRARPIWLAARVLSSVVRGIHEGVWGLIFVIVLGLNPLVAVLAIALPYGAITAKVYADLIDETGAASFRALRATGAPRLTALLYGVIPSTLPDLVSYAFYRLECSMRAGVILGMIGAGGLGFELTQSFNSLRYNEMWTIIGALIILSTLADQWSARLRRRGSTRNVRATLVAAFGLTVASGWYLGVHPSTLWSSRTREQLSFLGKHGFPPRLDGDAWARLWRGAIQTVQISILAAALAATLGLFVAMFASRENQVGRVRTWIVAPFARTLLLLARAIPAPVWALLVLFVVFPGIMPAAIALGLYTFGVLGRLMAEVIENLDWRPTRALRATGAGRVSVAAYAQLPLAAPKLASLSLYRWEVAIRETILVGVVGTSGLGRILERQRVGLDYRSMATTVIAMIVLTLGVDVISGRIRRSLG